MSKKTPQVVTNPLSTWAFTSNLICLECHFQASTRRYCTQCASPLKRMLSLTEWFMDATADQLKRLNEELVSLGILVIQKPKCRAFVIAPLDEPVRVTMQDAETLMFAIGERFDLENNLVEPTPAEVDQWVAVVHIKTKRVHLLRMNHLTPEPCKKAKKYTGRNQSYCMCRPCFDKYVTYKQQHGHKIVRMEAGWTPGVL